METKDKIQIAALILITIFIMALIIAIVVLAKNADEIRSDPVQYAIDHDFYDSCSCFMQGVGQKIYSKETVIQNWTS